MGKNVGKTDSIIRYCLGIVFLVLAFAARPFWLFFILAIVAFATAYFGKCLLYKLIGINTCKIKS